MPEHPDIVRLRAEYASRAQDTAKAERYSIFNPAHLFSIQQRQRAVLKVLHRKGFYPLSEQRILELGCGSGGVLIECLNLGAVANNLHGAELLFPRVRRAHQRLGSLSLTCADGCSLPYAENSFDLTMQFTVFSSILDDSLRQDMARELMRVTRAGGLILWYDFGWNPINRQTRGIRPAEIKRLFPEYRFQVERITLAPPLARRLVPFSWSLALYLETLRIFNTHYLVAIQNRRTVQ